MRSDIDHLPAMQRRELARITRILLEEFDRAIAGGTQPWRRNGRILKIILYGSYARGGWVDTPTYQSDYDILVIVSHKKLTDDDYWNPAEDRLLRAASIRRVTNVIVHTLGEVNEALTQGRYFWTDIARDGIALYDFPGRPLATPQPLTPADALAMAEEYHEEWLPRIATALEGVSFYTSEGHRNDAAFTLHQSIERAYSCYLLVRTLYVPHSHKINFLRSLAEDEDTRLIAAWPHDTRRAERPFNLIKRAYVEARYSRHYRISEEDLAAATASARRLRDLVAQASEDWIEELRKQAAASPGGPPA